MPSIPYVWNNTHVDIMLEDKSGNDVVKEKNLTAFFKGIGVEGLSAGTIRKLMKAGYTTIEALAVTPPAEIIERALRKRITYTREGLDQTIQGIYR